MHVWTSPYCNGQPGVGLEPANSAFSSSWDLCTNHFTKVFNIYFYNAKGCLIWFWWRGNVECNWCAARQYNLCGTMICCWCSTNVVLGSACRHGTRLCNWCGTPGVVPRNAPDVVLGRALLMWYQVVHLMCQHAVQQVIAVNRSRCGTGQFNDQMVKWYCSVLLMVTVKIKQFVELKGGKVLKYVLSGPKLHSCLTAKPGHLPNETTFVQSLQWSFWTGLTVCGCQGLLFTSNKCTCAPRLTHNLQLHTRSFLFLFFKEISSQWPRLLIWYLTCHNINKLCCVIMKNRQ